MDTTRTLIADDHTLVREALAELITGEEGVEVVAEAGSAGELVRRAREHQPHVVLMDIEMPGNDHPPSVVRAVQEAAPGAGILILTMHEDPKLVQTLLPLGIRGFLHKTVTRSALLSAVRMARMPGKPVTVSLSSSRLLALEPPASGPLSPREAEVLELAAQGMSNYQIARRLSIVEGTVKRHMRSIFDKLEARSRVEASNRALQLGLIASPLSVPHQMRPEWRSKVTTS